MAQALFGGLVARPNCLPERNKSPASVKASRTENSIPKSLSTEILNLSQPKYHDAFRKMPVKTMGELTAARQSLCPRPIM